MSLLTRVRAAIAGASLFFIAFVVATIVWLMGARNPYTPAGYVGYVTKGAFIGQSRFYGVQCGPGAGAQGHGDRDRTERNAPSAKYRLKVSPTRCRSSVDN